MEGEKHGSEAVFHSVTVLVACFLEGVPLGWAVSLWPSRPWSTLWVGGIAFAVFLSTVRLYFKTLRATLRSEGSGGLGARNGAERL